MNQIIDCHCHLNLEPLYSGQPGFFPEGKIKSVRDKNWRWHWQQAHQQGVTAAVVIGAEKENSLIAVQIANQEKNLKAAVGIHPETINRLVKSNEEFVADTSFPQILEEQLSELESLAAKNDQIAAIGETGLDYYRLNRDNKKQTAKIIRLQKQLFIKQIEMANRVSKPLVVHTRDENEQVYWDVLQLLQDHYQFQCPFVLHCISGPLNYVREALDLGGYVSTAGNITYPSAQDIREIAAIVPEDRLLVETDAPFLAPQKKRGKINRPAWIKHTVEYLQKHLQISPDQLAANSKRFYVLDI